MQGFAFATGMPRSGTSMLQMLLDSHPDLFFHYQPFYQFYSDVKKLYLAEQGFDFQLPLGDDHPERTLERQGFAPWLEGRRFSPQEEARLTAQATQCRGGGAPELADHLISDQGGDFLSLMQRLHRGLARCKGRDKARIIGSKEVLCEDYLPHLLDRGVRCLLLVRDPRSVVASQNYGRYMEWVGDRLPLLLIVRRWRQSVANWNLCAAHPLGLALRYEDLVSTPEETLTRLADWLGVSPFPQGHAAKPLVKQAPGPSSSFGERTTGVAGRDREAWQDILSPQAVRFIEAATRTEMTKLGYAPSSPPSRNALSDFVEDLDRVRPSLLALYHYDAERRQMELDRWDRTQP